VKVTAYVPVRQYTRYLPEYVTIYDFPMDALDAGEILWKRGARYLVVVEAELDEYSGKLFEKYWKARCHRDNLRVVKVRAARP